jgi:Bacterial Ig-like domain (group 3)
VVVLATPLAGRGIALTVVLSLLAGVAAAPPAALAIAIPPALTPTTTTLGVPDLDPAPAGHASTLVAVVAPAASGNVTFYDNDVAVETVALTGSSTATHIVPAGSPPGKHSIRAEYRGDLTHERSLSEPRVVTVGPRQVAVVLGISGPRDATGATARQGDVLRVAIDVQDAGTTGSLGVTGTVTVWVDGTVTAAITYPAVAVAYLSTAAWPIGPRSVVARFEPGTGTGTGTGTDHAAGSSSAAVVRVTENVADAVGLKASYPTFYPYRDGYRDTTVLRGQRDETAKVEVWVRSAKGRLVMHDTLPFGIGPWGVTWDGRDDTGRILAAGRYTVKQTVTDAVGASRTFTSSVTLSHKRLHTYTVTLKKSHSEATVNRATSEGWVGWKFTLPPATVYRKVVFAVHGASGTPKGTFGPHDYDACPSTATWDWSACMSPYGTFPATTSWKSVVGSVGQNRHGTTVRLYAVGGYRTAVQYARVTVTYAILK